MPIITLLVYLIVFCIIAGLIYWLLTLLPLPEPFKRIVLIAFILICVIILVAWLLQSFPLPPLRAANLLTFWPRLLLG